MHTPELCCCGLKSSKRKYSGRGMVAVHFNNHGYTLEGSDKFIYNTYNYTNKVANITKANELSTFKAVYLQH